MNPESVVRLLSERGLPSAPLVRRDGGSNAVWFAPGHVVRIHRTGLPGRLEHEARVLARLPAAVARPRVVDVGWAGQHDWMIAERLTGVGLGDAWSSLTELQRHRAASDVAEMLRAIHSTRSDGLAPPCLWLGKPVLGIDEMAQDALAALAGHEGGDRAILDLASAIVRELGTLMSGGRTGLVHGDCYLNNVMWDEGVVAVLDLEFARSHPVDTDLVALIDSGCDGALGMIAGGYPELFEHPRLRERLLVYELCTRAASLRIPFADHGALRRIRQIVDGEWPTARARW